MLNTIDLLISQKHAEEWKDSGIDPKITALNLQSLSGQEALEAVLGEALDKSSPHSKQYVTAELGRLLARYAHLEEGGWWCSGLDPLNNWKPSQWGCFKPDEPRPDPTKEGKLIKYEHPPTVPTRAIFLAHPDANFWQRVVSDASVPIILVEGAKKAGAVLSCLLRAGEVGAAIALPGIWNGLKDEALIPELALFATQGRRITICFDQDEKLTTQKAVGAARRKLAEALMERGCEVFTAKWATTHKGIDDFLVAEGGQATLEVLTNARRMLPKASPKVEGQGEEGPSQRVAEQAAPKIVQKYNLVKEVVGDCIAFNTLSQQIELGGEALELESAELELALKFGIAIAGKALEQILTSLAKERSYSPVANYLSKVAKQHGPDTSALEGLASRYFRTTKPLYDLYLRRTLIGAVARALDPGCKLDTCLVLQGAQGIRKSSFFKVLAGDWFDDSMGDSSDKDERLKLHTAWFVEWAELESTFRRRDQSATKAFISCAIDNIRPPYARSIKALKRPSIIVGSTNQDEFLADPTGNRRFWVVPVGAETIDLEALGQERDRIWAAATAAYMLGEPWWLEAHEQPEAEADTANYAMGDPWEEALQVYTGFRRTVTVEGFLTDWLKIDAKDLDRSSQMRVTATLRAWGWIKERREEGGIRRTYWSAPTNSNQGQQNTVAEF
jgi:predicted P-loop ATPase